MIVFSTGVRLGTCSLQIQYCCSDTCCAALQCEKKWGCGIIFSSDTVWRGSNVIHLWQLVAQLYITHFINNARQSDRCLYFQFCLPDAILVHRINMLMKLIPSSIKWLVFLQFHWFVWLMLCAFECDTFDWWDIVLNQGVGSKLEILYVVSEIFQIL